MYPDLYGSVRISSHRFVEYPGDDGIAISNSICEYRIIDQ
jgi:hypothetical protein